MEGRVDLDTLEIPDFRPGPPEVAERRELAEAVLAAVASLPPKYRVPLTMFHLDGLSYGKVAEFLDIPLGTVKTLIHRAREKLRVALAAYTPEEASPMVQEVFNEHRLPAEFSREVWALCMDWLSHDALPHPSDPAKRKARAERVALAAARDSEVALVSEWRQEAEPIPEWALAVSRELPRWGIEICHAAWLQQLERAVWMVGHETAVPRPAVAECGTTPAARRQWAALAEHALSQWLAGGAAAPEDPRPVPKIHALLGSLDDEKAAAVRLMRDTIRLRRQMGGDEFDQAFEDLDASSNLAREMKGPMGYLHFWCGYRWDRIVLELCRAIGDPGYRARDGLSWHVGACTGQIAFVYRDDPARIPTTGAILVGTWAWLREARPPVVESTYPTLAPLAEHIRQELGAMTPVKRWLAGRLFVGIRIWLQELDHGDLEQPRPALEPYPTLVQN